MDSTKTKRMKLLKQLLFILISCVVIILITALFVNKTYTIERKIVIQKNPEDVYNYLKFIKNQELWCDWQQLDPSMKKYYKGEDGTVGFVYTWLSNNEAVGEGEQELKLLKYPERIECEIHFTEPNEKNYFTYFQLNSKLAATELVWGYQGRTPWPFNLLNVFSNPEEEIGPDLEKGLKNLKKQLEGT